MPLEVTPDCFPSSALDRVPTLQLNNAPVRAARCLLRHYHSSLPQGALFACAQADPLLFARFLQALLQQIQELQEKVSRKPLLLSDPISNHNLHLGTSQMLSPHGQIAIGAYVLQIPMHPDIIVWCS